MEPGLCGVCRHAKVIETATSRFYLCLLSQREPTRFRRYPPLPVLRCVGHEPAAATP